MTLEIETMVLGPVVTNTYLVGDSETKQCVVIDWYGFGIKYVIFRFLALAFYLAILIFQKGERRETTSHWSLFDYCFCTIVYFLSNSSNLSISAIIAG